MTDRTTDDLKNKDHDARWEKIYDSPGMQKMRVTPKRTPEGDLRIRQADERAASGAERHREGKELLEQHERELAPYRQSNRPIPKEVLVRHTRQRGELTDQHDAKRRAESHRHLEERDRMRTSGRK
jgi:hypothetical protein